MTFPEWPVWEARYTWWLLAARLSLFRCPLSAPNTLNFGSFDLQKES
jgi:hypothetical protein